MKTIVLAALIITGVAHVGSANAENWQTVGSEKDALGRDTRIVEIDLDHLKSTAAEIIVKVRTTDNGTSQGGYNCSEGALRHGKVNKKITNLVCNKPNSPNPYGDHEANWVTVRVDKIRTGEMITKLDLNSISRTNNDVMVTEMSSTISKEIMHFDCKGYYKIHNQWNDLVLNDQTAPRGSVSLERKISNRVCSNR